MNAGLLRVALTTLASLAVLSVSAACSDPAPATPRVILDSTIGPGANGQQACQISSREWVTIGGFAVPPRAVEDGAAEGQGAVSVVCSVTAEGGGFKVAAQATLSGPQGGSVSVSGHFNPTGTQPGIRGVFQNGDFGRFEQSDCTVDYVQDGAPNTAMGVAAGRVWATMTCPTATLAEQGRTCQAIAQFRFENCAQ